MLEARKQADAVMPLPRLDSGVGRVIFLIDVTDAADALARVLCPFAVQQAILAYVELRRADPGASIRIEVEGLSDDRAQVLARRLEQFPIVRSLALGWRSQH